MPLYSSSGPVGAHAILICIYLLAQATSRTTLSSAGRCKSLLCLHDLLIQLFLKVLCQLSIYLCPVAHPSAADVGGQLRVRHPLQDMSLEALLPAGRVRATMPFESGAAVLAHSIAVKHLKHAEVSQSTIAATATRRFQMNPDLQSVCSCVPHCFMLCHLISRK